MQAVHLRTAYTKAGESEEEGSNRRSGSRCSENHTDVKGAEPGNAGWLGLAKRDVAMKETHVLSIVQRKKGGQK